MHYSPFSKYSGYPVSIWTQPQGPRDPQDGWWEFSWNCFAHSLHFLQRPLPFHLCKPWSNSQTLNYRTKNYDSSVIVTYTVQFMMLKHNPVLSVHRSTTMVWSPSTSRSASSHQRLFPWATADHSSLHFGQMCTMASVEMSTTERALNQKYWKGRRKMSGSTSKTCPPSLLPGPLLQHGTKSPSMEEARQPR